MTLWIVMGVMCFAAVAFAVMPLVRRLDRQRGSNMTTVAAIVAVVGVSTATYGVIGNPGVPSGAAQAPDVGEMVDTLAARLRDEPDDLDGWKMLGRSHMTLGNYPEAAKAYERAIELESAQNAQTLVGLGEALLAENGQNMNSRIVSLFENALALEPNNPSALFWGGIGAINRGDKDLAASRWETLLATNPPPEIRGILQQRIAEWRGQPVEAAKVDAQGVDAAPAEAPAERAGAVVSASIDVSEAAKQDLPTDATVFVIARDPAQPSPPIAVTRWRLSELPATVELGDADSMIPGRSLSGFSEFELVARVSLSGQPAAVSGDWFGATVVKPAGNTAGSTAVALSIDSQVP